MREGKGIIWDHSLRRSVTICQIQSKNGQIVTHIAAR